MAQVNKTDIQNIQLAIQLNLRFLCQKFLNTTHWSKIHDELAAFLKGAGKFIHIELPRGHLKSWIVTKGWTIQQILKNPNIRVLIVNATEENATKFMRTIERFLGQGALLEKIYGSFVSPVWNQNEFIIRQRTAVLDAPTIMGAGLQKTLTSQHFDLIIADDLVEPDNVRTKEQREKVYDFYLSLFDLLEPQGRMIVIGTRYHQDDLYSKILEDHELNKNWSVFIRNCWKDGEEWKTPIFPEKFTVESLKAIYSKPGGKYHFAAQYMNNPIDPDSADFKADYLRYYDPTTPNPGTLYLTVDPAISLSRDADFTAMVVAGMFNDRRIRVVDRVHKRLIPSDLVDQVFELVTKWRLHRVGIETFAFQKTLKYEIQRQQRERGIFFTIDELGKRHQGRGEPLLSKEARIRRLQPYFEQGLVEIRRDMQDLADELLAFPRGKHDDLCFVADTRIATPFGDISIQDLTIGDKVITPTGVGTVSACGFTGVRPVVQFANTFATQNHPVFTYQDGFIPLDTLTYRSDLSKLSLCELYRWVYRSLLISMVSVSDSWGRTNIILASRIPIREGKILKDFMWRCGNFIRGRQFRKVITFITRTGTRLITTTRIWCVYRATSILKSLKRLIVRKCKKISKEFDRLPPLGINLRKAESGTGNMLEACGRIQNASIVPASTVAINSSLFTQTQNSVPGAVLWQMQDNRVATESPNHALSVMPGSLASTNTNTFKLVQTDAEPSSFNETLKPVYNLTVEGDHCYFANGFLVSNCDALSYQLDYLVPSINKASPIKQVHGSMDWWIKNHMQVPQKSIYDRFFSDLK